ncbi:helix-turn-helix domain-containing protein [Megasphaera sueciensis]|uniref:helix-turn-helix domain-containing protein n=1 Tax=Megasphaera sueciensis TaxID=349094 RepID=UPI003D04649A
MVKTTAKRLKEALDMRGLKQTDLAQLTGLPKSAISQYISGKIEPKQDKLYILAKTLNVDVLWLMGIDSSTNKQDGCSDKTLYYNDPEVAALAEALRTNPNGRILFDASKNLKKEDIQFIVNMINELKKKEGIDD